VFRVTEVLYYWIPAFAGMTHMRLDAMLVSLLSAISSTFTNIHLPISTGIPKNVSTVIKLDKGKQS